MTTDFRSLCAALLDEISHESPTTCLARAALAEPQPEPPTDGEVAELVVWLLDGGEDAAANGWDHQARQFGRAAELLQRLQPEPPTKAELKQLFDDHSGYINDEQVMWWSDFHAAARAVLARWSSDGPAVQSMEPASVVTEPSDKDLHSLWLELYAFQEGVTSGDVTEIARAVLARWGHQPAPPAEGEVAELVDQLAGDQEMKIYRLPDLNGTIDSSKSSVPQPVPVSERLPGPEDCLDEGWAWFFNPRTGWRQATQPVHTGYTHWLPADALPLP